MLFANKAVSRKEHRAMSLFCCKLKTVPGGEFVIAVGQRRPFLAHFGVSLISGERPSSFLPSSLLKPL